MAPTLRVVAPHGLLPESAREPRSMGEDDENAGDARGATRLRALSLHVQHYDGARGEAARVRGRRPTRPASTREVDARGGRDVKRRASRKTRRPSRPFQVRKARAQLARRPRRRPPSQGERLGRRAQRLRQGRDPRRGCDVSTWEESKTPDHMCVSRETLIHSLQERPHLKGDAFTLRVWESGIPYTLSSRSSLSECGDHSERERRSLQR